jgi:hypothetical protein
MMRVLGLLSMTALFSACGGDANAPPPDVTMFSSANPAKYVANALTVPLDRMQYGMDLNGDGKLDNQLGNIIGALSANNLDTQKGVNDSVCKGAVILLLTETSDDATWQTSDGSGALIQVGKAFAYTDTNMDKLCNAGDVAPKYDGTDTFMVDSPGGFAGAQFAGRIVNGTFSSNSPVTTTHPVSVSLQLPLVAGAAPVELKIIGAHIQFKVSSGKITGGQINGAIRSTDVTNTIIPNVANLLDQRVTANPTGSTEKQILQIFDIGCPGMDNLKGDGHIATCEVSTNSIIKNVLNADVQMFAADGVTYHPNPANTMKDSLSLGLGFTAVKASF